MGPSSRAARLLDLFNLGLALIETGAPERGRPLLERFLAVAPPEAERQREAAARALGR